MRRTTDPRIGRHPQHGRRALASSTNLGIPSTQCDTAAPAGMPSSKREAMQLLDRAWPPGLRQYGSWLQQTSFFCPALVLHLDISLLEPFGHFASLQICRLLRRPHPCFAFASPFAQPRLNAEPGSDPFGPDLRIRATSAPACRGCCCLPRELPLPTLQPEVLRWNPMEIAQPPWRLQDVADEQVVKGLWDPLHVLEL